MVASIYAGDLLMNREFWKIAIIHSELLNNIQLRWNLLICFFLSGLSVFVSGSIWSQIAPGIHYKTPSIFPEGASSSRHRSAAGFRNAEPAADSNKTSFVLVAAGLRHSRAPLLSALLVSESLSPRNSSADVAARVGAQFALRQQV